MLLVYLICCAHDFMDNIVVSTGILHEPSKYWQAQRTKWPRTPSWRVCWTGTDRQRIPKFRKERTLRSSSTRGHCTTFPLAFLRGWRRRLFVTAAVWCLCRLEFVKWQRKWQTECVAGQSRIWTQYYYTAVTLANIKQKSGSHYYYTTLYRTVYYCYNYTF